MNGYATSIDEMAWFALLFLFEAETYWLSEEALTRLKRYVFVTIRLACYGFLIHTMYAYWVTYLEFANAVALPSNSLLCDLAGQDYSFLRNLAYTLVDAGNCGTLSSGGELFRIGDDLVVTDAAGLSGELGLAIVDIIDVTAWLCYGLACRGPAHRIRCCVTGTWHVRGAAHHLEQSFDGCPVFCVGLQRILLDVDKPLGLCLG
jgi:hypothetical protein